MDSTNTNAKINIAYSSSGTTFDTAVKGLVLQNTDTTTSNTTSLIFGTQNTGATPISQAAIYSINGTRISGFNTGQLGFAYANSSGVLTEAMRINSSGNVGIGTSSPGRNLSLKASDLWQKFEETAGSGRSWLIGTGTQTNFRIYDETANLDRMAIDIYGNLLFNSGYGSAAIAYGCRTWVNFNGTGTVAIRASGNVSSITDNGTGDYTVNFAAAMPDANYSVAGMGGNTTTALVCVSQPQGSFAPTTSAVRIQTTFVNASLTDPTTISVQVFR